MTGDGGTPLLTLEPFIEAVREGVDRSGWVLSGLQKTTSYQFEGRWEGDSTRSAYLFFHHPVGPEWASVDVYLDETSRGLTGNLALVVDTRDLGGLGDVASAIGALRALWDDAMVPGHRTALTLRLRSRRGGDPLRAEGEVRFKLVMPRGTTERGGVAVSSLAGEVVSAFQALIDDPRLAEFREEE
ncbi:MAG: hypothetical protein P8170_21610 [Gemmatimonadota bacterium]